MCWSLWQSTKRRWRTTMTWWRFLSRTTRICARNSVSFSWRIWLVVKTRKKWRWWDQILRWIHQKSRNQCVFCMLSSFPRVKMKISVCMAIWWWLISWKNTRCIKCQLIKSVSCVHSHVCSKLSLGVGICFSSCFNCGKTVKSCFWVFPVSLRVYKCRFWRCSR